MQGRVIIAGAGAGGVTATQEELHEGCAAAERAWVLADPRARRNEGGKRGAGEEAERCYATIEGVRRLTHAARGMKKAGGRRRNAGNRDSARIKGQGGAAERWGTGGHDAGEQGVGRWRVEGENM